MPADGQTWFQCQPRAFDNLLALHVHISFVLRQEYPGERTGSSYVCGGLDQAGDDSSALGRDSSVGAGDRCGSHDDAAKKY